MYSIKTDLDITGSGTVGKDLLVKGNAVFKNNLTVMVVYLSQMQLLLPLKPKLPILHPH